MSNNSEQLRNGVENGVDARQSSAEQLEKLKNNPEASAELSPRDIEAQAERARVEALESAISVESGGIEKEKPKDQSSPKRRGPINKRQRDKSYAQTMQNIQKELPTSSKIFSKIIHNKFIESSSEILGNTVARPNAMLAGGAAAFILTLLAYTVAKTIGYALSGFETIAAFVIGWVIGISYDYLRVLITGKKS